jgi:uncharacterized membrane protein YphA (DoxX/SURF4 family)
VKLTPRPPIPGIGRPVYGLAAIALGAAGLAFRDFARVGHPVPASMPFRTPLALAAALALVAGGLALQWGRTVRAGLVTLAILYLLAALLWMPRVLGYPEKFDVWSGFAEQFCLVAAAMMQWMVLRAASDREASGAMQVTRVLFGVCVMAFGVVHFTAMQETAGMVPGWVPPSRTFWAAATGGAMFLAGVALVTGIMATLAARLLTALIMSFGLFVWIPISIAHPHEHTSWAGNALNLAIAAAAWMVADVLASAPTSASAPVAPEATDDRHHR